MLAPGLLDHPRCPLRTSLILSIGRTSRLSGYSALISHISSAPWLVPFPGACYV